MRFCGDLRIRHAQGFFAPSGAAGASWAILAEFAIWSLPLLENCFCGSESGLEEFATSKPLIYQDLIHPAGMTEIHLPHSSGF